MMMMMHLGIVIGSNAYMSRYAVNGPGQLENDFTRLNFEWRKFFGRASRLHKCLGLDCIISHTESSLIGSQLIEMQLKES